jgi:hypothetical protein
MGAGRVDLEQWRKQLILQASDLRAEIESRRQALEVLDQKIDLLQKLTELEGEQEESRLPRHHVSESQAVTDGMLFDRLGIEDAVFKVLDGAREPLHISEIRKRLVDGGARIPGRGDDANIIVRLRNHPERFVRTARGTYGLKSWGLEEMRSTRRGSRSGRSAK